MTLAQLEERVTVLKETLEERLAELERIVEGLQTRPNGQPNPDSTSGEQSQLVEEDSIPGTEYDLVVTVPPEQSIFFRAHIVSIEPGPPGLPLSEEEWASLGLEDEHG